MDVELERLIDVLIDGIHCYNCGTPLLIEASELDAEGDGVYTFDYPCAKDNCEGQYAVSAVDEKEWLRLEYSRTDEDAPEEPIPLFERRRKEDLQRQADPVKNLLDGYYQLNAALALIWQNRKRITEACDSLREDTTRIRDKDFHRRVHADIHNYVASAYSFQKILDNTKPNIPTDGPVQDALHTYYDDKRVIIGLRIYAQKQFTIPVSIATFAGESSGEYNTTIGIRLDKVNVIDSDVEWSPPDGYSKGASHHYGEVDGKYINLERRVNLHYQATEDLLREIGDRAEDEIEEQQEVISYAAERDEE